MPAPPVPEVVELVRPVAETAEAPMLMPDPPAAPEPEEAVEQPVAHTPGGDALPVAGPVVRTEARGSLWLIGVTVALLLLLLSAILFWYFSFQASHTVETPEQVGQRYMATLVSGNTTQQQTYATERSIGRLMPAWFVVVKGDVTGKAEIHGDSAKVPVTVTLNLAIHGEAVSTALAGAVSRPLSLPLEMHHERRGWQVDQTQLWTQIQQRMIAENPGLTLPQEK